MDIFERLNDSLAPLERELFIDRFVRAMIDRAGRQPEPAAPVERPAVEEPRAADTGREGVEGGPAPPDQGDGVSDSQKMRIEVQEFLQRDRTAQSADEEISEFMNQRHGIDPNESV